MAALAGGRKLEDHELFPEDQDQIGDLDLKKVDKVILIFDLDITLLIF